MMKISACIITLNEEENILAALESLDWADEVVVVDSGSIDKTIEIAKDFGAKVISKKWMGFGKQKQFAVESCSNDWVFSLDADERVSEKLKEKILKLKEKENLADGYRVARLSFYMDRAIKHSGWYPDWQLRLFNRKKGKWKDVEIHESFEMDSGSDIEYLREEILHFSVKSAAYHHKMIGERYAPLAAQEMFKNGRKTSSFKIAAAGFTAFFQSYILKGGFMDGLPGFCIARFAAHHAFLKHLLLWEKLKSGK